MVLAACSSPADPGSPDAAADGSLPDAAVIAEFDLGGDFSSTTESSGVWRYGYTTGTTLALDQFALDTYSVDVAPIHFWHPGSDAGAYYPYVAAGGGAATTDASGGWAVRPGEIALEASNTGQYSVVEFVAPQSGTYTIEADYAAIHFHLSTTDAHVRRGELPLFDADLDGYGGDPSFHAITGNNPTASYQGTLALQANEIVSFALGMGKDGTNFNDTTGLRVHIQLLR
jgi:hypothetical protein